MTKQAFEPSVPEDLNRKHSVTLTEGQISTILYVLEGYINPSDDYGYDPEFRQDIDSIFGVLEGAVDSYYDEQKQLAQALYEAQQKQPKPEWDDYGSKVDALVDSMNPTFHMDQAFAKAREEL